MLHGVDPRFAADEAGTKARFAYEMGAGRQVYRLGQVGAAEHDPGIGLRRTQREAHLAPSVQAHASGADQGLQCSLAQHSASILPTLPRGRPRKERGTPWAYATRSQSACLRRNAGMSYFSTPLAANASTWAARSRRVRKTA